MSEKNGSENFIWLSDSPQADGTRKIEHWKSETIDLPTIKRTPTTERLERNTEPWPYSADAADAPEMQHSLSGPHRFEYTNNELTELEVHGVLIKPGMRVRITYVIYDSIQTTKVVKTVTQTRTIQNIRQVCIGGSCRNAIRFKGLGRINKLLEYERPEVSEQDIESVSIV